MKQILILILSLLSFSAFSQEDPNITLTWEKWVDKSDFVIPIDTLDQAEPIDSTVILDTVFKVYFRAIDTLATNDGSVAWVTRQKDSVQYVNELLDELIAYNDAQAEYLRKAAQERANTLPYLTALQNITGEVNAYTLVYDKIWPQIGSLNIRTTLTDEADPYYVGNHPSTPNISGIVRDTNNVIVARIFPRSYKLWSIVIANNGSIPEGEQDFLYSDNGISYINWETDPTIGRVIIRLNHAIR